MEIYKEIIKLENEVSSSQIMRIMQDVGGRHNKSTGLSKFVLAEKGLFWIILSSYIKLRRYPEPGEELEVISWRGERKRNLLPRYFMVNDMDGNLVFKGSALWAMLSKESHKMVCPAKYGFQPEWTVTGQECRLPAIIKPVKTDFSVDFVVPEEYIDTNKHMNNTNYFDMCERCLKDELYGKRLKEAHIDYVSEAMLGDSITLSWKNTENGLYIQGDNQKTVFRAAMPL